jgi:hypothetical protein
MHWGKNCWDNYKNIVKIKVDDSEALNAEVTSRPEEASDLGGITLRRKLDARITMNVHVKVSNGWFPIRSREHGEGSFTGKVNDLRGSGTTIDLDKYGNKVVLKIKEGSLPDEPRLPDWRATVR